jgi:hypothetical protein
VPKGPKPGSKAGSTVINQVLHVDGVFRKPEPRGRSSHSDAGVRNLDDKLDDMIERRKERERLRQDLHDFIDANPNGWSGKQRKPCISAVRDKVSGRTYFNHNVKTDVDRDNLDPILKERFDRWQRGGFKDLEGPDAPKHGTPGQHSETRAMNEALKAARAEGREPRLEDFMIENAKIMNPGNPGHKAPMPCCQNCSQLLDGADGAWNGWDAPFGSKKSMWDGKYPD